MIILAIDTSCDDTSVAVTEGVRVLSSVISSQVRYHKKFGGVVPFLAQRLHSERIDSVIELALQRSGKSWGEIEAIAVTYGPGLAPALQVGVAKAKELAVQYGLPLYAINHMVGHIAGCFAGKKVLPDLPALALLVSGGHTELVLVRSFDDFEVLGETLDDAIGEAYDKVGRMLGLGYPGGRLVAKLAEEGDAEKYELPIPMSKSKDLNFSYSGLKNAVRLLIASIKEESGSDVLSRQEVADVCAAFQRVSQASLLQKLKRALDEQPEVKSVLLGGGVAANTALRSSLRTMLRKRELPLHVPANLRLCPDNAAMIGVAAGLQIGTSLTPADIETLDRKPGLRL